MRITQRSVFSGMETTMDLDITEEQMIRWSNGELIQDVMPHLNDDEREFLMTGAAPGEWDAMFGDDDEY